MNSLFTYARDDHRSVYIAPVDRHLDVGAVTVEDGVFVVRKLSNISYSVLGKGYKVLVDDIHDPTILNPSFIYTIFSRDDGREAANYLTGVFSDVDQHFQRKYTYDSKHKQEYHFEYHQGKVILVKKGQRIEL